jgi:hypothetical protein
MIARPAEEPDHAVGVTEPAWSQVIKGVWGQIAVA